MSISVDAVGDSLPERTLESDRPAVQRELTAQTLRFFLIWTAFFWGGVGVLGALFFVGALEFPASTKLALYGISIWLNGWLLVFWRGRSEGRSRLDLYHECLLIWMVSYALTNVLWEIPWIIFSPFVFTDLNSLDDIVAHTDYMRSNVFHMYWWVLAAFGSVDLRTVNHDSTFYSLEMFSFVNVASLLYFLHLNAKRSPYRYLIVVLGCGEPIAATFIFTFSEVFGGYVNMAGGLADTLLALVWTQYQYFVFPMIFGVWGFHLLREDLRRFDSSDGRGA